MAAATLAADGAAVTLALPTLPTGPLAPPGPPVEEGYAVLPGQDEIVTVSLAAYYGNLQPFGPYGGVAILSGYGLDGSRLFQTNLADNYPSMSAAIASPTIFAVGSNGEFGAAYDDALVTPYTNGQDFYALYNADGSQILAPTALDPGYVTLPAVGTGTPTGFHMEWVTEGTQTGAVSPPYQQAYGEFKPDGSHFLISRTDGSRPEPYASAGTAQSSIAVRDNQILGNGSLTGPTLPGEPSNAVTSVGIAFVSGPGAVAGEAAVAWIDSGTAYAALYYAPTATFGPVIGLDWGGATDVHVVGLPSAGGFVVSWMNGGEYKGEVFDAAGRPGGVISLAGDVAGVDSHGDLFTVGLNGSGQHVVQTYAINGPGGGGSGGGGSGSEVFTSDPTYTAPDGVTIIHLTGANQTVTANNAGDVIWSDNTVNHLIGGSGNDVFHLGRGGDIATGGGGNDIFSYAEVPWNGGHITDFGPGDVIDLTGLLHQAGYTGDDPVGAHYLSILPTIVGAELQVFAVGRLWEIGRVDGVAPADLQVNGDLITLSASGAGGPVSTSASSYVAPADVTSITLTGSQQHIDASATTTGVTINSNDTGNTLVGGSGADVFHLGRGGDVVTGGAGADDFLYAQTPWAGGVITDFDAAQGDRIDVGGLLQASRYIGSDPFADGYLKYTTDSSGDAQLWSDINLPGNDGWWLVATLDGVSTSSLHYANGLIT
jgi:hypothetical protein